MKTYARIQQGIVAELFSTDGDITQMFHPDLVWIDVTNASPAPQIGWAVIGGNGSGVGGVFSPPVPPTQTIPQSVTPAQGLMALYALKGITEGDILAAIGNIEDSALRYQAQITYNKATTWQRTSVSMQVVAGLLALTESNLDELFTLASTYSNL